MLAVSFLAIFTPSVSSAQTGTVNGVIQNPLNGIKDVPTLVSTIMADVVKVGGVIAIFAFIYSGYKFVEARGNSTELETAKKIFFNTCIGVAILLGAELIAFLIVTTIKNLQS